MERVGVLALQGGFAEHIRCLRRLDVIASEVRLPRDMRGLDGLIIPGGESTSIGKLAERHGLIEAIEAFAAEGKPILGTCAGLVLLAQELVDGPEQPLLGLLPIRVRRNAFGRQRESFETWLRAPCLEAAGDGGEQGPFPAVFIRAPVVEEVGAGVEVLARLDDGRPVAVRHGRVLGLAFHPELTDDLRWHWYFLSLS